MTFQDLYHHKRTSEGFLENEYVGSLAHASALAQVIETTAHCHALPQNQHILDHWLLHPGLAITQRVEYQKDGDSTLAWQYTHLTALASENRKSHVWTLPPYTIIQLQDTWWHHPISRGWSPLKWWFANREEQARSFAQCCERHLTPWDWHLAGLAPRSCSVGPSAFENVLRLCRASKKDPLNYPVWNNDALSM